MKYLCSNCSIELSKNDLRVSDEYCLGLLCWDCLCRKNICIENKLKHSQIARLLGVTDDEFISEIEETERDLIADDKTFAEKFLENDLEIYNFKKGKNETH